MAIITVLFLVGDAAHLLGDGRNLCGVGEHFLVTEGDVHGVGDLG